MAPKVFEARVAERLAHLSPAEQRVVHFFQKNREEVLIASAAALAAKVQTSDATVVRAVKALGFSGLDELRRTLAEELRDALSPAERLTRTLTEVGDAPSAAFEIALGIQLQCLESLRSISLEEFAQAVDAIVAAKRVLIFGIGPSSAIADYFVVQLGRFGIGALGITHTGLQFADDLAKLHEGDLVVMLAYGQVYAEVGALLDEIHLRGLRSLLLTDTLAAALRHRVDLVLVVPRGRADLLSMHTPTLGFIEALLVGIAARRPAETLASLRALNEARERLAGKLAGLALPEPARQTRR